MRQHRQTGQTLLEFVVVMPIIVVLLLAATYIGFALYNYHVTASHTRGLHKKLEHYATLDSPLGQMQADIANGYSLSQQGGSKFGARVVRANKTYSIPGLSFIPPIELMSSTAFPGALFFANAGSSSPPPDDDPITPPLGGMGSPSIQLADHPSLQGELFGNLCVSSDYCYGTDLATGNYASADLAAHYPPDTFFHIADDHGSLTFPGGVYTDEACEVSNAALGLSGDTEEVLSDPTDEDSPKYFVPIVSRFLADIGQNHIALHPQCIRYCIQPSVSADQAEVDACINPCIAGKLANAKAYVQKHIDLATDNHGCAGETIFGVSLPVVQ